MFWFLFERVSEARLNSQFFVRFYCVCVDTRWLIEQVVMASPGMLQSGVSRMVSTVVDFVFSGRFKSYCSLTKTAFSSCFFVAVIAARGGRRPFSPASCFARLPLLLDSCLSQDFLPPLQRGTSIRSVLGRFQGNNNVFLQGFCVEARLAPALHPAAGVAHGA